MFGAYKTQNVSMRINGCGQYKHWNSIAAAGNKGRLTRTVEEINRIANCATLNNNAETFATGKNTKLFDKSERKSSSIRNVLSVR